MAAVAPVLLRLLATSHTASAKAGQIVRDVMAKGDLGIVDKGKDDLQTEADCSAQRCIIAALSKSYPKATIIGEEGQSCIKNVPEDWTNVTPCDEILQLECPSELANVQEEDITIWVDPLDGTKEYTEGLVNHVTVLIGVAVGQRPVGGIIHQPFYDSNGSKGRTIWGMKGVGIGGFTVVPPDHNKFIITTSRSHANTKVENALKILKPDEVIRVGGAGYKVILLLEGKAHAYVFPTPGCKRWDTCAPEAVLNAVGGILSDTDGQLYSYDRNTDVVNSGGVLAAYNTEYHLRCINALKVHEGIAPGQIGAVTPYHLQSYKIRFMQDWMSVPAPKVASVNEFQRQERMVIIVSVVRSSPEEITFDMQRALGFVANARRLYQRGTQPSNSVTHHSGQPSSSSAGHALEKRSPLLRQHKRRSWL